MANAIPLEGTSTLLATSDANNINIDVDIGAHYMTGSLPGIAGASQGSHQEM